MRGSGALVVGPRSWCIVVSPQVLSRSVRILRSVGKSSQIAALAIACLVASAGYAQTQSKGGSAGAATSVPSAIGTESPSAVAMNPTTASPEVDPAWRVGAKLGDKSAQKNSTKYDVTKIGDRGIGGGMNMYSIEREMMLGRQMSAEIEQSTKLITDPLITEYVNRVGQNIVRNSDAKVPFTIKVIDDEEINAFALPGGFFYVNTGLLMAADNEAELASVMAHEIAHVAARHATKNATRSQIWNIASIPLIFVGGPVGYAVRQVAGLAVPMGYLKFSRDAEREADLLGLEYEYAAGYDPAAFVQFFEKLRAGDKKKHNFLAKAFATHPMTEDRIKRAQEEIQTLLPAREQYVVDTSEFEAVKSRLAMLENRNRLAPEKSNRPTLRRREPAEKTSSSASSSDSSTDEKKDGDRPVLRRKD